MSPVTSLEVLPLRTLLKSARLPLCLPSYYVASLMTISVFLRSSFDGRAMAYSPTKLPADEGTFIIDLPEEDGSTRSRQFTVYIRYTRPIDLGRLTVFVNGTGKQMPDVSEIQSAVQALNICIQHG